MSDSIPAFPTVNDEFDETGYFTTHTQGMDLRDYFAAKALHVIISDDFNYSLLDSAAEYAYKIADAMLKARVRTR